MVSNPLVMQLAEVEFLSNISPDTRVPEERNIQALISMAADLNEQLGRRCLLVSLSTPLDWQVMGVYEMTTDGCDIIVCHKFLKKNVRVCNILREGDRAMVENNFSEHRAVLHILKRPFRQPLALLFFTDAGKDSEIAKAPCTPDKRTKGGEKRSPEVSDEVRLLTKQDTPDKAEVQTTNPAEAEQLHVGSGGSLDAIWHAAWNNFLKHLVTMQAHVCCWIFQSFDGHTF